MQYRNNIELSPHEKIRCQFSGSKTVIKLGIDVRQDFVVVAGERFGFQAHIRSEGKRLVVRADEKLTDKREMFSGT